MGGNDFNPKSATFAVLGRPSPPPPRGFGVWARRETRAASGSGVGPGVGGDVRLGGEARGVQSEAESRSRCPLTYVDVSWCVNFKVAKGGFPWVSPYRPRLGTLTPKTRTCEFPKKFVLVS